MLVTKTRPASKKILIMILTLRYRPFFNLFAFFIQVVGHQTSFKWKNLSVFQGHSKSNHQKGQNMAYSNYSLTNDLHRVHTLAWKLMISFINKNDNMKMRFFTLFDYLRILIFTNLHWKSTRTTTTMMENTERQMKKSLKKIWQFLYPGTKIQIFSSISRLNFRYFKYIALMPFLPAVTSHLYQICSLAFFSIILFVSQLQASDSIFSRFLKLITLSLTLTLVGGLFEYHSP